MSTPWKKTFYALCIAQFIAMLGFSFVMPFLPFYIKHLPMPVPEGPDADKWAGIIMMAGGLPMVVFSPIWGLLADRYGRNPMVLRAMLGGAVVIALMGCAQNITHLLILRILQGTLTGTVGASMALAASVTPRERAGTVLGTLIVSSTSGQYIGPVLGGYSAKFFGYESTFFLAGGILIVGGLIVQFAVRETFTRSAAAKTDMKGSFWPLLTTGAFIIPVVTLCLINFSATAPGPIFPYFVKRISAMSDAEAGALTGLILSIVGPVEASSAWMFGFFGDRWGQKRVLMFCVVWGGIMASLQAYSQTIGQTYPDPRPVWIRDGGHLPDGQRTDPEGRARAEHGQGLRHRLVGDQPGLVARPRGRRLLLSVYAKLPRHVHAVRRTAAFRLALYRLAREAPHTSRGAP